MDKSECGKIDFQVLPTTGKQPRKAFRGWPVLDGSALPQYLIVAAVVLAVTVAAFLLEPLVGYRTIALVFYWR